ncbi:hypothetical protein HORIV_67620 [Vreelandella olivaria]|uniref:Uncharacterized protein n=1 Tax=Vreelandella olivaria TaxID=390919 RepID=A0ABM7GUD2_9GAMM|nr:hypothetical protein HORIV_67620 [Halomonas olivaria]
MFGISLLGSLATIQHAQADNITLTFHSGLAQSRPEAAQIDRFAQLVKEKSEGELEVEVYHAGALGLKEADMLRILQQGMVDMALLYGEYYTRDAPALASVYAQGAITESSQHTEILSVIRELYDEGFANWDIQIVGGVVAPIFDVGLHCKEPVNTLEELKDKRCVSGRGTWSIPLIYWAFLPRSFHKTICIWHSRQALWIVPTTYQPLRPPFRYKK